jgi:hypothetical protein
VAALPKWTELRYLGLTVEPQWSDEISQLEPGAHARGFFDAVAAVLPARLESLSLFVEPTDTIVRALAGTKVEKLDITAGHWMCFNSDNSSPGDNIPPSVKHLELNVYKNFDFSPAFTGITALESLKISSEENHSIDYYSVNQVVQANTGLKRLELSFGDTGIPVEGFADLAEGLFSNRSIEHLSLEFVKGIAFSILFMEEANPGPIDLKVLHVGFEKRLDRVDLQVIAHRLRNLGELRIWGNWGACLREKDYNRLEQLIMRVPNLVKLYLPRENPSDHWIQSVWQLTGERCQVVGCQGGAIWDPLDEDEEDESDLSGDEEDDEDGWDGMGVGENEGEDEDV